MPETDDTGKPVVLSSEEWAAVVIALELAMCGAAPWHKLSEFKQALEKFRPHCDESDLLDVRHRFRRMSKDLH
jgi:hypothetical protein